MNAYIRGVEDREVHRELRNLLEARDLILFAGSGLSAQASTDHGEHPPLWKGLLDGMIHWCEDHGVLDEDRVGDLLDFVAKGYLIEAGQELQDVFDDPSKLMQCLGEIILCKNQARIREAHRLIAQIPFRAIITTNYDKFIEGAFWAENGLPLQKYYQRTLSGVLEMFWQRKPFILKLHGDLNDPTSIVLGYRAYERLLYADNAYRFCLETIFATSSVLFMGFGGSDPDLDGIVSRVAAFDGRRRCHWMLVPAGTFPSLKAKRLLKDKGINLVQYEKDESHSGVVTLLRALAQRAPIAPVRPLEQGQSGAVEIVSKLEVLGT